MYENHRKREIHMRKLESCKGTHLPMRWTRMKLKIDKTTQQKCISVQIIVDEKISEDLSMRISFLKCDSSGNPDSCEYILEDKEFKNVCRYLEMNDQPWSLFFGNTDKKLMCPIKPDTYSVVDLPINASALIQVPIPDALWIIRFVGFDRGKKVSCVETEFRVVTVAN